MGKLILISGPNDSGKSLYAEQLIAQTKGDRHYIATMRPCTEENHRRIEKHRTQRQGLGFRTLEYPYKIGNAPVGANSVVLLEDVSNLLANAMFDEGYNVDYVFQDTCDLLERCGLLVAVTISGLNNDGYDEETAAYIDALNEINQKLLEKATVAVTMQNKTPVYQKGDINDFT